jgi:dihydroorotase
LIFRGGRVLDPANDIDSVGDLRVEDGVVRALAVGSGERLEPAPGEQVMDCAGKVVCPGLIDIHVHLRVPGQEYKEDLGSGLGAAAAGGFTAVACMPNTNPFLDSAPLVRDLRAEADKLAPAAPRLHVIAALAKNMANQELAEMADLKDAGAVAVSDDAFAVQDAEFMRRAMEYAGMLGLPVLAHCEDARLTEGGAMNEGYTSTVLGIRGMPREAYEIDVARNILLSLLTGCHLTCCTSRRARGGSDPLGQSAGRPRDRGNRAALLVFDRRGVPRLRHERQDEPAAPDAGRYRGGHRGARDGTLDCIATDHAPHALYEKQVEFAAAPFGIVGLETSLALGVTHLVRPGHLSLAELIRRMSAEPARILKLPGGTLAPGAPADVTVFDPEATWTVVPEAFVSKGRNTPFAGHTLTGRAVATVVNGEIVYEAAAAVAAGAANR